MFLSSFYDRLIAKMRVYDMQFYLFSYLRREALPQHFFHTVSFFALTICSYGIVQSFLPHHIDYKA